jgi:zinc protease
MSPRPTGKAKASRRRMTPALSIPFETFQLSCGATLKVTQREGAPITSIDAHVRGGPSLDPKGFEGTAYLTGGLCDQGTRKHNAEEIAEWMEPYGGEVQGESSGLSGSIVSSGWKELAGLICEMLTEPSFPVADVYRQKERLLQRLSNEASDARQQGALAFRRMIYQGHWMGRPAYGSVESVARIEPKHLRAQHRKYWVASRGLIGVCCAEDPRKVRDFFERRLSKWKSGKPMTPRQHEFAATGRQVHVVPAKRKQVHVFMGHLGIRRKDPDYAALVVLDHVLGQGPGFTDRISRRLRDELGLAYTVSAGISGSAGLSPGTFTAYIGTSPEHVGTAIEHFLLELHRIQDELVPADELQVAKDYLTGSFGMGFERASRRSGYLVTSHVHNFPADNLQSLPREFEAVTSADVQRVARKHLFPDRCCLSAAGPVKKSVLEACLRGK